MEVRSFKALLGIGAVLLFSAFSSAGECRPLEVVASGTIIADIAKNIGGDKVSVRPLIGYGGEMHFYTEKPSDLKLVGKADLILKNCLDLDTWADRLAKASGTKAKSVCVTDGITPIRSQTGTDPMRGTHLTARLPMSTARRRPLPERHRSLPENSLKGLPHTARKYQPLLRNTKGSSAEYQGVQEKPSQAMPRSAILRETTASISDQFTVRATRRRKEQGASRRLSGK